MRVAAAIAAVPRTPAALVDLLDDSVTPALRAIRESVMLAHLLKLGAEGRAVENATGAWRATPRQP